MIAGAAAVVVAIVAVVAFVFVGHKSALRPSQTQTAQPAQPSAQPAPASGQPVLPFTGLNGPDGVAVDTAGTVYVADSGNNRVLTLATGSNVQTVLPRRTIRNPSVRA